MFGHKHYVPILKSKASEWRALDLSSSSVRELLTPLVEITPPEIDHDTKQRTKSIEVHVATVANQLAKHWGTDAAIFLDTRWIRNEVASDGALAATHLYTAVQEHGLIAVPAIGPQLSVGEIAAAKSCAKTIGKGICFRITDSLLGPVTKLNQDLLALLSLVDAAPSEVDLVLDFGTITQNQAQSMIGAIEQITNTLVHLNQWRTYTTAMSAFPESLSRIKRHTQARFGRTEWQVWQGLLSRPTIKRRPTFGDYAIEDPDLFPPHLDPRAFARNMSVNLRYSTPMDYLVIKRGVRRAKDTQFLDLCRELVAMPEYSGASFSWGDKRIYDAAMGTVKGSGSPGTWRQIGFNHHFALVADQIARTP